MTKVEIINKLIELGYTIPKYSGVLWKTSKADLENILRITIGDRRCLKKKKY